jgi:hypothetical protein
VFTPEELKGASKVVCPGCGSTFQLRATAPSSSAGKSGAVKKPDPEPAATTPPEQHTSTPPPLPPVPPVLPAAETPPKEVEMVPQVPPAEARGTGDDLDFSAPSEIVVPRTRRQPAKKSNRRLAPLLAILTVIAVGVGVAIWGGIWLLYLNKSDKTEEGPLGGAEAYNFAFTPPGKPWKRDKYIEMKLHVNFAMRSVERNNNLALAFKDYNTRSPSNAEMVDGAREKLHSYFPGAEWEPAKETDEKLGGQPALLLTFEGEDPEHVAMSGECRMVTFRGFAYWFFTWGPTEDKEKASAEWEGLRRQFRLLEGRKGWAEKAPDSATVRGDKARYGLTYRKGLWARKNAHDFDPLADVALLGAEPDKKYASQTATFQVLVLPKEADLKAAAAAARKYLEKRQKELYSKIELRVMKDKDGEALDRAAEIGNTEGRLAKFHLLIDEAERFLLLAVVNRLQGVVVLLGECQWDRRDFWDQEFTPLLKSFRVR